MDTAPGATPTDLWAALHAPTDVAAMSLTLPHAGHGYSDAMQSAVYEINRVDDDGDHDEDEEDDEEEEEEEHATTQRPMRSHAPLLLPQGGLPPSFYATTGLPDVMPSFMVAPHLSTKPFGDSMADQSASEMFLDDILRGHDESFMPNLVSGEGDLSSASGRLTVERLSQLEDNYERKKKRAKINRRDLNSRFQELMDLLHLKEDRKLNRAKVLEKAVEHIQKLTAELKSVKAQLAAPHPVQQTQYQAVPPFSTSRTPGLALHELPIAPQMPMQQWSGPPRMAMRAPIVWMPVTPSTANARSSSSRPASATSGRGNGRRSTTVAKATATTQTSPERTAEPQVSRPSLKRSRTVDTVGVAISAPSTLAWVAQEVHALLEFCDAWSLSRLMATCRDLRIAAKRDALWSFLCQRRWRLSSLSGGGNLSQWTRLHSINHTPQSLGVSSSCLQFASSRHDSIGLWVSLVRRSNGRTTRTVLVEGKAVVRQVVELNVLVQNTHPCAKLRLLDQLHVGSSSSSSPFQLITTNSRAHLTPHLLTVNDVAFGVASISVIELLHCDLCVLSVFVECEGLDLEQQFLERVNDVTLRCELVDSEKEASTVVDVVACVNQEATQAQVASHYPPIAVEAQRKL